MCSFTALMACLAATDSGELDAAKRASSVAMRELGSPSIRFGAFLVLSRRALYTSVVSAAPVPSCYYSIRHTNHGKCCFHMVSGSITSPFNNGLRGNKIKRLCFSCLILPCPSTSSTGTAGQPRAHFELSIIGLGHRILRGSLDKHAEGSARRLPEQGAVRIALADEGGDFSTQGCGQRHQQLQAGQTRGLPRTLPGPQTGAHRSCQPKRPVTCSTL